jgi:alpha-beta hydrolase superfamily lysophospholipase
MSEFLGTPLVGEVLAPATVRGALVIVHGLGEHRGRYERAAEQFGAASFATVTYDQRGHGGSPGERTDIEQFSVYSEDLARIVEGVISRFPGVPVFLWGHSMGALVLLDYAENSRERLAGCITSGCPLDRFSGPLGAFASGLGQITHTITGPRLSSRLDPELLTHDEAVMNQYREDRKVVRSITWRLYAEMARASRRILRQAHDIQVPWLLLHGTDDRIAPLAGSQRLYQELGSKDKQLVPLDGLRHEMHNELPDAAARFFKIAIDWMGERLWVR